MVINVRPDLMSFFSMVASLDICECYCFTALRSVLRKITLGIGRLSCLKVVLQLAQKFLHFDLLWLVTDWLEVEFKHDKRGMQDLSLGVRSKVIVHLYRMLETTRLDIIPRWV